MAANQGQINQPATGTVVPADALPINFAIKFVDVNVNRAIQIEPDQETVVLINLTKNIITPVR